MMIFRVLFLLLANGSAIAFVVQNLRKKGETFSYIQPLIVVSFRSTFGIVKNKQHFQPRKSKVKNVKKGVDRISVKKHKSILIICH